MNQIHFENFKLTLPLFLLQAYNLIMKCDKSQGNMPLQKICKSMCLLLNLASTHHINKGLNKACNDYMRNNFLTNRPAKPFVET